MAYNLPVSVSETSKRRRKGTKRWSFIIKKRKGPQRVLGIRSQKELMKRKSVKARYIQAMLLEPIRTDSFPVNDLLTQWKIPELSKLLPPLSDRITDPGAKKWPFPVWTFDDGKDPSLAPTVFMLPKIAIQAPELTSAFLPSMEPMVVPARPMPIAPDILPFKPIELDIAEPDYEAPVPKPAPTYVEPVTSLPDLQKRTVTPDSAPFVPDEYKADPPWVIIRVKGEVRVNWYPLFAWKRLSWIQVFDGSSMLIHDSDESQLLKDSVSSWGVYAELAKVRT
jgi:hypothetical protein